MSTIKKPYGRSLDDFLPLLPAEQVLCDAVHEGKPADIGNTRPKQKTHANHVRAEFLRFLALGGDEDASIHERGIRLQGAWISNLLDLEGCNIPSGLGLTKCHFEKRAVFRSAHIHGLLNLNGSQLPGLTGDRLVAEEGIFMRDGFIATETVRLLGTQIDGNLDCNGGEFNSKKGHALIFENARIQGSVFLRNGFKARGTVRLLDAQIGSSLSCDNGEFDGKEGHALSAARARIQGSVFLRNGFKARGTVCLIDAQIGSSLSCDNGEFDGKEGDALSAGRARIQGSVFLRNGFKALGTVRLTGAQIDDSLSCDNGEFDGKEGDALSAERAKIQGSVFLRNGFKALGTVRLTGAQIDGNLNCQDSQFNSTLNTSLMANSIHVRGCFRLKKLKKPANGINLAASQIGQLADDEASWGTSLVLDGFIYEHFSDNAPTDTQTRLKWLKKQRTDHFWQSFRPQPWKQLIRVLHNMGHGEDARRVAISYEEHRRKAGVVKGGLRRTFHRLFGLLIGYGYRPLRLFYIMLSVWLFCAVMFWSAALHGVFAPSNPLIFHHPDYQLCRPDDSAAGQASDTRNWYLCPQLAGEYTGFSPLAYSLDLILPLVDLQQEHDWAPYIPAPQASWLDELGSFSKYHWTRLLVWLEVLFGWLTSVLLVAVVSGLTNRDKDD